MIILLAFLVCVIGLVIYLVAANPKVAELGRIAFGVGLFVMLTGVGGTVLQLFRPHP